VADLVLINKIQDQMAVPVDQAEVEVQVVILVHLSLVQVILHQLILPKVLMVVQDLMLD
jgi:hypothetical protein